MYGKIIKGIAGFYYVKTAEPGVYECKAKGVFRKEKLKPLVGDEVEIEILDEQEKEGNIIRICERKNELIRPAAANIDQVLVVFAAADPAPHLNLLDRFLVMAQRYGIPAILCFNKTDIGEPHEIRALKEAYRGCGCEVIFLSVKKKENTEYLRAVLKGKITALAGPSGVGKSSLINLLVPDAHMETGSISRKISRGKHTTRHAELFSLDQDSYIMDTPGFSSLYGSGCEAEELRRFFPEFHEYEGMCRFQGCMHLEEPGCAVKEALDAGEISLSRYQNYKIMAKECKQKRRY